MKDKWFLTSGNGELMRYDISLNFPYENALLKISNGLTYGYGAIFIVHKDQILQYSKEYWQRLYDSLQDLLPTSGWGCEKLWGYLLGDDTNF